MFTLSFFICDVYLSKVSLNEAELAECLLRYISAVQAKTRHTYKQQRAVGRTRTLTVVHIEEPLHKNVLVLAPLRTTRRPFPYYARACPYTGMLVTRFVTWEDFWELPPC